MRFADWRLRLREEVAAARLRPTAFGEHDCLQFAARCVLAMTGEDHRERFPPYGSPMAARSILDANGGVAGILTACLGEAVPPNHAHIGDVVVARFRSEDGRHVRPTDDRPGTEDGAGICLGAHAAFCGREGGVVYRPRSEIRLAWRVP
jgi:hypothetical protein